MQLTINRDLLYALVHPPAIVERGTSIPHLVRLSLSWPDKGSKAAPRAYLEVAWPCLLAHIDEAEKLFTLDHPPRSMERERSLGVPVDAVRMALAAAAPEDDDGDDRGDVVVTIEAPWSPTPEAVIKLKHATITCFVDVSWRPPIEKMRGVMKNGWRNDVMWDQLVIGHVLHLAHQIPYGRRRLHAVHKETADKHGLYVHEFQISKTSWVIAAHKAP